LGAIFPGYHGPGIPELSGRWTLACPGGWQRRNRLETDEEIQAQQAAQLRICWGASDGPDQETSWGVGGSQETMTG